MSCGQIALERVGIKVENYFASEIDKYAIQVTQKNYPNTKQLGSVVNVDGYSLPKIDLLIGGSPCQSFSFAGKRKGMATKCETEILTLEHYLDLKQQGFEFEGQSYLFWEYMRLLNECKPKYFLLENVVMGEKWQKILTRAIGINPIQINSALVCAQNRNRLYWTNIASAPVGFFGDLECSIKQPKDKGILLKDILEKDVDEKYFLSSRALEYLNRDSTKSYSDRLAFMNYEDKNKSTCLTANHSKGIPYNMVTVHDTNGSFSTENIRINNSQSGTVYDINNKSVPLCANGGGQGAKTGLYLIPNIALSKDKSDFTIEEEYFEVNNKQNKEELILAGNMKGGKWDKTHEASGRVYDANGKAPTIPTMQGGYQHPKALINSRIRRLTPIECARLQTVKDSYLRDENGKFYVSDSQLYKMLGNGWTVDVIAHIFSELKKDIQ